MARTASGQRPSTASVPGPIRDQQRGERKSKRVQEEVSKKRRKREQEDARGSVHEEEKERARGCKRKCP